ncbi:hypothetical protein MKA35_20585 [[Clostridium] innocuum]|nr:hypothetical protein [[Clostridium] innocuum]
MKNKRVQKLSEQKLLQYGCSKEGITYRCIRKLKAPYFYAVITYEGQELSAEVYDAQLREPYTPFHVPGANGSFVSSIREEVEELLEDMGSSVSMEIHIVRAFWIMLLSVIRAIPNFPGRVLRSMEP